MSNALLTPFALCVYGMVPLLASAQEIDRVKYLNWGVQTYQQIELTLGKPQNDLYAEIAQQGGGQSGVNGLGFAWPLSTQFRVLNSLARLNPGSFTPKLRAFSDQFHSSYWSSLGGYSCCSGGGDRFYDDNAHIAVALAEAYEITGDTVYLDRAEQTYDFLLTGEAPGEPGSSYWSVQDHTFLDTASSLQGARAALMLYKATSDSAYLSDAASRYQWANQNTQIADGTYLEKVFLTGPQAGTAGNFALVNFAGFGISANLQFYDVSGNDAYLLEAQRIAGASLNRYFDAGTGRINDEGYWAFELVDALVDLYERDGDQGWLEAVAGGLDWLHDNKKDPAGHYGKFWGREGAQTTTLTQWELNDMAAVARAYFHLAQSSETVGGLPGDFNEDGSVDAADYTLWRNNRGEAVMLPNDNGLGSPVGESHYLLWQNAYGASSATASTSAVPEPSSAALLVAVGAIAAQLPISIRRSTRYPTRGLA